MSYFSLRARTPSESSESSESSLGPSFNESDDSHPELATCPRPGKAVSCTPKQAWVPRNNLSSSSGMSSLSGNIPVTSESTSSSKFSLSDPFTTGSSKLIMSEDGKIDNRSEMLKSSAVEPPRSHQAPDWHALFFTESETYCDEILIRPEVDTYFEDCKLAEDAALNFVAKVEAPVFGSLRAFNQTQVAHALKSIPNQMWSSKEQLIALITMLDFLSCCCQKGNLLSLYEKCKDAKKRSHINIIDSNLRSVLDRLNTIRLSLEQLLCVEQLVKAALKRIPASVGITYFSVEYALKRKITAFEMEEKNKNDTSIYHFREDKLVCPAKKKFKASTVTATSGGWEGVKMDFTELLRSPHKTNVNACVQFSSTPKSAQPSSPESGTSASHSTSYRKFNFTSSIEKSSARGIEGLNFDFDSSEEEKPIQSVHKHKVLSKENTAFQGCKQTQKPTSSFISSSKKREKKDHHQSSSVNFDTSDEDYGLLPSPKHKLLVSKENSPFQSSKKTSKQSSSPISQIKEREIVRSSSGKSSNWKLEVDKYSSDDSLPDVCIDLPKKPISEFFNPTKQIPGKNLLVASPSKLSLKCPEGMNNSSHSSTTTPKSLYKSKFTSWSSKYSSTSNNRVPSPKTSNDFQKNSLRKCFVKSPDNLRPKLMAQAEKKKSMNASANLMRKFLSLKSNADANY